MKQVFLILLCFCLLLTACAQKNGNTEEPDPLPDLPEPVSQVEPTPDTTDYQAALHAIFTAEETPQSEFEFDIREGNAILTAYTGEETVVRVPSALGDFPVVEIADGVFQNQENLNVLILPETVVRVGSDVLKNTELKALCMPLPEGTAFLGSLWGFEETVGNRAPILKSLQFLKLLANPTAEEAFLVPANYLSGCTGLVAVELPNESKLGDFALANCENLMYLNAAVLTTVGEKAMDGCSSLQSIRFGSSLTQIGHAALRNCRNLMELELPFVGTSAEKQTCEFSERTDYLGYLFGASKPAFAKGFYPAFLKKITLLEGCTELSEFALYECASLQILLLPTTLARVGGRALSGCTALTELIFPDACREIGDAACAGCTSLSRVQLPNGIAIGQNAFLNCPMEK